MLEDRLITIVQGKCRNAYYFKDELILCSNDPLGNMTQLFVGLGFQYTYLERFNTDTFPDNLSDLHE